MFLGIIDNSNLGATDPALQGTPQHDEDEMCPLISDSEGEDEERDEEHKGTLWFHCPPQLSLLTAVS
jgi:hypothetical protein